MKVHFVTFADTKLSNYSKKIAGDAQKSGFYDVVHTYDENTLDKDFLEKHGDFIKNNKRGYGYWIWKPQVCIQTFEKMEDGDILVYADVGCVVNPKGVKFHEFYLQMAIDQDYTVIDQMFIEAHWTKGDIFKALDAYEHANTGILYATNFYLKKTPENVKLVKDWLEWCSNYNLLTDVPSVNSNLHGFVENRHDQSFFSLLNKKMGRKCVPVSMDHIVLIYKGNYEPLIDYPLWYLRVFKDTSFRNVLRHYGIRPDGL